MHIIPKKEEGIYFRKKKFTKSETIHMATTQKESILADKYFVTILRKFTSSNFMTFFTISLCFLFMKQDDLCMKKGKKF